jgi:hypothetical protein
MKKLFIAMALACQAPAAAIACAGPFAEKVTLLEALPAEAMSKEIVAKVKIISYKKVDKHRAEWKTLINAGTGEKTRKYRGEAGAYVDATVLEGIKGVKAGENLTIFISPFHSCSREPYPPEIDREVFIAGDMKDGIVEGEWHPWFAENTKLIIEKAKQAKGKQH